MTTFPLTQQLKPLLFHLMHARYTQVHIYLSLIQVPITVNINFYAVKHIPNNVLIIPCTSWFTTQVKVCLGEPCTKQTVRSNYVLLRANATNSQ